MSPITDDQREQTKRELWIAVLKLIEDLPAGYGGSRSQAFWSETGFSITCLCIKTSGKGDGSDIVYHIEAHRDLRFSTGRAGDIRVTIMTYLNNHDQFWGDKVKAASARRVIVGNRYYSIGDEYPKGPKDGRGFSGRLFKITMTEAGEFRERNGRIRAWDAGETIETTNLWSAGIIAPAWRDQLPDNAEFVPGFEAW